MEDVTWLNHNWFTTLMITWKGSVIPWKWEQLSPTIQSDMLWRKMMRKISKHEVINYLEIFCWTKQFFLSLYAPHTHTTVVMDVSWKPKEEKMEIVERESWLLTKSTSSFHYTQDMHNWLTIVVSVLHIINNLGTKWTESSYKRLGIMHGWHPRTYFVRRTSGNSINAFLYNFLCSDFFLRNNSGVSYCEAGYLKELHSDNKIIPFFSLQKWEWERKQSIIVPAHFAVWSWRSWTFSQYSTPLPRFLKPGAPHSDNFWRQGKSIW